MTAKSSIWPIVILIEITIFLNKKFTFAHSALTRGQKLSLFSSVSASSTTDLPQLRPLYGAEGKDMLLSSRGANPSDPPQYPVYADVDSVEASDIVTSDVAQDKRAASLPRHFLAIDDMSDGEHEIRLRYGGVTVKETSVGRLEGSER